MVPSGPRRSPPPAPEESAAPMREVSAVPGVEAIGRQYGSMLPYIGALKSKCPERSPFRRSTRPLF
jgi:hypothetical protein